MNCLKFFIAAFITILMLYPNSESINTIFAQSSSSSAKPSTTQSKIEELKKEIASKAANLKLEVNKKIQNKFFAGTILEKNESNIKIASQKGEKIILTDEYTNYKNNLSKLKNTKITNKDINKNDFIYALGDINDKGEVVSKLIIKDQKIEFNIPKLIWGKIQTFKAEILTILGKENQLNNINLTDSTNIYFGNEESSSENLKVGNYIISVQESSKSANSDYIYIIPKGGSIKAQKTTTPSAKFKSATPSAKISPTPKTSPKP